MTGSSAMTRRMRSRRVDRVSSPIGPASVADNPAVTSAERAANWAASRLRARPKSVPATTIPAHTIPMQISLTRVTANVKASPFTPPVAPSRSLAMTTAVKPASAAPYEAKLRRIVATKPHAAPHAARPTRKPMRLCGKHAVSNTIATAPTTVPIMRNEALRSEAPRLG